METVRQCAVCFQTNSDDNNYCETTSDSSFICRNCWDINPNTGKTDSTMLQENCLELMDPSLSATVEHNAPPANLSTTFQNTKIDCNQIENAKSSYEMLLDKNDNNRNINVTCNAVTNCAAHTKRITMSAMTKYGSLAEENDNGEHGFAEFICIDCWEFCIGCGKAHTKTRNTKKHIVKRLNEISDDDEKRYDKKVKIICKIHQGELIHLYCTDCFNAICSTCLTESHPGHKITG